MTAIRKVGIIGIGPRGGYALERLIFELADKNGLANIHLFLFEATGNFGNGQVYDLHQNESNWINISERILKLDERKALKTKTLEIPSFPSYHQWIAKDFHTASEEDVDTYPPRAQIGAYLSQRFQSLIKPLIQSNIASLYEQKVKEVKWLKQDKLQIITDTNTYEDLDEILLTIGHQPTALSQQIVDWDKFATNKKDITLFKTPYPVANYLNHKNLKEQSTIGIRGFGLAMIDVVRAIAEKFGSFTITEEKSQSCIYQSEQTAKNRFIPFSLDGLPPAPKPLNAQIDKQFEPSEASITNFKKQIENKRIQREATSPHFLIAAFAPIAASIYTALAQSNNSQNLAKEDIEKLIVQYLKDHDFTHPLIVSKEQSAEQSMKDFVGMAIGEKAVSLDFCIGQVWRHCQPTIYQALSFNDCSESVFADIIALDEWTKRYSYGPPVASIQQLLALVEAGVLNLDLVNDPDIEWTDEGWQFQLAEQSITATIMIDSVLDSPKIKAVKSPIVENMLNDDLIQAVHDDLGVSTDDYGYLISKNKDQKIPIALLGRLAKGTIIGVDAILECFGTRPQQWAKQAASNHVDWLNKN